MKQEEKDFMLNDQDQDQDAPQESHHLKRIGDLALDPARDIEVDHLLGKAILDLDDEEVNLAPNLFLCARHPKKWKWKI